MHYGYPALYKIGHRCSRDLERTRKTIILIILILNVHIYHYNLFKATRSTRSPLKYPIMPAIRNNNVESKHPTRQMTLTGKPAPTPSSSSSSKPAKTVRVHTDAVLAIKTEFAELIASRKKNHEYRVYQLRDVVKRIWLYELAPVSQIR